MLPGIAHQLEVMRLRLEGHDVCENCGCELEEEEIVEGEDGELLCEECADEMYESIEETAANLYSPKRDAAMMADAARKRGDKKAFSYWSLIAANKISHPDEDEGVPDDPDERQAVIQRARERGDARAVRKVKAAISQDQYQFQQKLAKSDPWRFGKGANDLRGPKESIDECACQDESTDSDEDGLTEKSKKATSKFRSLVSKLAMHNAKNPVGLAAWIGAKKMGKGNVAKGRKMLQKMAVKARKSA